MVGSRVLSPLVKTLVRRHCSCVLPKIRRWPSLRVAGAESASVLVVFVIWTLVDASFNQVLEVALIDLRIRPDPWPNTYAMHGWDRLGSASGGLCGF